MGEKFRYSFGIQALISCWIFQWEKNFGIRSQKKLLEFVVSKQQGPCYVECYYAWKLVSSSTRTLLKCNLTIFLTKKIKKSLWHKGCFNIIPDRFFFVSTRNAIWYHHYNHHHHYHHHHYRHHHHHLGLHSLLVEKPLLGLPWFHRCLCLVNLDHTGLNCLVR